jgi:hypothetical protein
LGTDLGDRLKDARGSCVPQTGFVNDPLKDLFGRDAPGEECGDAPKRGLLGLNLSEMRINSGAIR